MDESSLSGEEQRDAGALPSDKGRYRLTKEARVRSSSDYRRIMKQGRRYNLPHFHIRMLKNPQGTLRLGTAVGKKAGNACARNRVKRQLREYFRLNRDKMPRNMDIVFIALPGAATLNTHELRLELDRFFEKWFCPGADSSSEG